MPVPSRPFPRPGARARVTHFGGSHDYAVVAGVSHDGRRLQVRSDSGEVLEFTLSPATAKFVAADAPGSRLELLADEPA